MINFMLGVN